MFNLKCKFNKVNEFACTISADIVSNNLNNLRTCMAKHNYDNYNIVITMNVIITNLHSGESVILIITHIHTSIWIIIAVHAHHDLVFISALLLSFLFLDINATLLCVPLHTIHTPRNVTHCFNHLHCNRAAEKKTERVRKKNHSEKELC